MKLSMWNIAERLEDLDIICMIKDGAPRIEGVRFILDTGCPAIEEHYVYLCAEYENLSGNKSVDKITLINGEDILIVQHQDIEHVLNRLLGLFDFYNRWESSLWELSSSGSLPQILDKGNEALDNPVILSDINGVVLAMSSRFRQEDLNENWVECRETGQIPTAVLGTPMRTSQGELVSWDDTPQILYFPDGTKTISLLLTLEGKTVAALSMWEYQTPITPGHLHLIKILCDVILSFYHSSNEFTLLRSDISILSDLLDGVLIDNALLQKLELRCSSPWVLITVRNPYRSNIISKKNMIWRMQDFEQPSIPMLYKDDVICLISAANAGRMIEWMIGKNSRKYYLAVLSMPFGNLSMLQTRYQQNLFCMEKNQESPGIYDAVSSGLSYALSLFHSITRTEYLCHPALDILKDHDRKKGSDLYLTLYYYLLYERSIQLGAQAVHIHRNSFLYRINRIRALTGINPDDPEERAFLLFSYYISSKH